MAIFFMHLQAMSRARGSNALSLAAYRAGERLTDRTTGEIFDHRGRRDVLHAEILLSQAEAGRIGAWARDREHLWNAAEAAEKRCNARVAREYLLGLPHELSAAARTDLARGFGQHLADRFGVAVDLAIHAPRPQGDPRNHHAHLLATTRRVEPTGLGVKADMEFNESLRLQRGLPRFWQDCLSLRAHWAEQVNAALREQGLAVRVDSRSRKERGLADTTLGRVPYAVIAMERAGIRTQLMQRRKAQVEAQRLQPAELWRLALDAAAIERSIRVVYENLGRERGESGVQAGIERAARADPGAIREQAPGLVRWERERACAREGADEDFSL
jgi:MobA/MobL family